MDLAAFNIIPYGEHAPVVQKQFGVCTGCSRNKDLRVSHGKCASTSFGSSLYLKLRSARENEVFFQGPMGQQKQDGISGWL